ncbi:MAG TPA: phosphatase PAP2 family protein [bacterium]|jgi:acid phosphatase (class A)|nr:phosphatase PAP2 family protein [bacterium]
MPRQHTLSLLLLALAGLAPAIAMPAATPMAKPYAVAGQVDLTQILAPPPGPEETKRELDTLLDIQKSRTAAEAAACIGDQIISVYRFADVLGEKFTAENLPRTNTLFMRTLATMHVPMEKAQKYWTRKRPPLVDPDIMPVGMVPATASYPSGHATAGNLMAIILADLVPERAAELHARGVLFGYRRVQAGVHYPSDIEAGRLSAAAIAQSLSQDPEFQADFVAARRELRAVLGLGPSEALESEDHDASTGREEKGEY